MKHLIPTLLSLFLAVSTAWSQPQDTTTARIVTCYTLRGRTASGEQVRGGIVAVSRDLEKKFPLHTQIRIEGLPGVYVVKDRTSSRLRGVVDVWRPSVKGWHNLKNARITKVK